MVDHEIFDSGLHMYITYVVDDGEVDAFQPEQPSRVRQRTIGDGPQNVGIDETNIYWTPEDVLPSTIASSPYTIIPLYLIKSIHATHVAVVVHNADWHRQTDDLSVASCWSHNVVLGATCGDHVDITLVAPFCIP